MGDLSAKSPKVRTFVPYSCPNAGWGRWKMVKKPSQGVMGTNKKKMTERERNPKRAMRNYRTSN